MFYSLFRALLWGRSLSTKLFGLVPRETFIVVILNLVSQVSLILAFLLPLKVIILLGSTGMPAYFPESWRALDRDQLVIVLSFSAAGAYLLYLISDRVANAVIHSVADKILLASQKTTLFENQSSFVVTAYRRYTNILSCGSFVILAVAGILIVYPSIILLLFLYLSVCFISVGIFAYTSAKFLEFLDHYLRDIASVLSAIGFLIMFGYMVSDFMNPPAPGVIQSIIGLLLVRQLLNRFVGLIVDSMLLFSQKHEVNALFFHGHRLEKRVSENSKKLWSILADPGASDWFSHVLSEQSSLNPDHIQLRHLQSGMEGVFIFVVHSKNSDAALLFKMYGSHRHAVGKREKEMLSKHQSNECNDFPGLHWKNEYIFDGVLCHIYKWSGGRRYEISELKQKKTLCYTLLMSFSPLHEVVRKYVRSHQNLSARLSTQMDTHLSTLVTADTAKNLKTYLSIKADLREILDKLPCQYLNPGIIQETLLVDDEKRMFILNWNSWSVEPVGAGWPLQQGYFTGIDSAFEEAKVKRKDLKSVDILHVKLAAYLFQFESMYAKHKHLSALEFLDEILGLYLELETKNSCSQLCVVDSS